MWETRDPEGRWVILTKERWAHVIDRHAYIALAPEDVLAIVSDPDHLIPGQRVGEEWFYGRAGPSSWIRVVVHFEQGRGLVITAFPRRSIP